MQEIKNTYERDIFTLKELFDILYNCGFSHAEARQIIRDSINGKHLGRVFIRRMRHNMPAKGSRFVLQKDHFYECFDDCIFAESVFYDKTIPVDRLNIDSVYKCKLGALSHFFPSYTILAMEREYHARRGDMVEFCKRYAKKLDRIKIPDGLTRLRRRKNTKEDRDRRL